MTENPEGIASVPALELNTRTGVSAAVRCPVVREDALTLQVEDIGHYTLMYTPTVVAPSAQGFTLEDGVLGDGETPEGLALALGFAVTEGLVQSRDEVKSLVACEDQPGVVRMQLRHPQLAQVSRRNVVVNSSCSICGPREILDDNALQLKPLPQTLAMESRRFPELMQSMTRRQHIFEQTGGSHAAAIFDESGSLLAVAEDLGRHNALDKAVGAVLLQRNDVAGCGIVLSSRLSLEMVVKAARSGLEMMVAVSAPTSLAIDVAQRFGVTLCGFVRDDRATVFSCPERVLSG